MPRDLLDGLPCNANELTTDPFPSEVFISQKPVGGSGRQLLSLCLWLA